MKWNEYRNEFVKKCRENGKSEEFIEKKLLYAENLYKKKLPIIYDDIHFSLLVGYSLEYIYKVSNRSKFFYRQFKLIKKNGKKRTINEPLPNLKEIQKWILENILYVIKVSPYIKSYQKGKSVRDNAKFHRRQDIVLTIDIKDYFPSIKGKKVYKFFRGLGYTKQVSSILTHLCLLNGSLPQGAPTSPMLSNIVTKSLDKRISKFCSNYKIRYTRYADDLTFSGFFKEGMIIRVVSKILEDEGFALNKNKIRSRKYM